MGMILTLWGVWCQSGRWVVPRRPNWPDPKIPSKPEDSLAWNSWQ
jgi:hypothetical protein